MDISKSGFQACYLKWLSGAIWLFSAIWLSSAIEKDQSENQSKQKAEAAENNGITAGHTNSYYLVFVISGGGLLSFENI